MSIIDRIIGIVAPYDCLGCGLEGSLLCVECARALPRLPGVCYRCGCQQPAYKVCANCQSLSSLYSVRAAVGYRKTAKALVWNLKFAGAQSAARSIVDIMSPLVPRSKNFIIVPIPTATSRIRRRGYDQTRLLVRELSRRTGYPVRPVLSRHSQLRQVGASRAQRLTQLQHAFQTTANLQDINILLVDDVLTTGATLEAAAKVLIAAGASKVNALTFARSL